MKTRSLLLVLAFAWMSLVPVPAFSQPSGGGPSADQYDPYGDRGSGVGSRAAHDAMIASGAIQATSEEAQAAGGEAASAAERTKASGGTDAASSEDAVTGSSAEAQDEDASSEVAEAGSSAEAQDDNAFAEEAQAEDAAETQDEVASAETQDENGSDSEKLPDTGGPSPLWLGAPLLCAGSLFVRKIFLP